MPKFPESGCQACVVRNRQPAVDSAVVPFCGKKNPTVIMIERTISPAARMPMRNTRSAPPGGATFLRATTGAAAYRVMNYGLIGRSLTAGNQKRTTCNSSISRPGREKPNRRFRRAACVDGNG